jgi:protein-S-isoprenylcysteine O-methyltransferase Ste14
MENLELAGAPLVWLWIFLISTLLSLPALIRGLLRRGTGVRYEHRFWVQRAPQLAIGLAFTVATAAFELIELRLGTGEPSFGKQLFVRLGGLQSVLSLAPFLPRSVASVLSWSGIFLVLSGGIFLIAGFYTLGSSLSIDAEILPEQGLRVRGPFRWVLHPVYSGYVQFLLGTAIVAVSPAALVVVGSLTIPLLVHRALYEERLLLERFGQAYEDLAVSRSWRRIVPTFIPIGF